MSSSYVETYEVDGTQLVAVGEASTKIKAVLKELGIASTLVRRASIIAYEAEMNVVIHGGGGSMKLEVNPDSVAIWAIDSGPGIPDIERAMTEGFSTASEKIREMGFGAGMGLPNIKRNADDFDLQSEVGKGTTLKAVIKLQ